VRLLPHGSEWAALNPAQQFDTLLQIWLIERMEDALQRRRLSLAQAVAEIQATCQRRWKLDRDRRCGIGRGSLLRKYYRAKRLGHGRRWEDFCRYRTLVKEKAKVLHELGLAHETVQTFFKEYGGITRWARDHGHDARTVFILASLRPIPSTNRHRLIARELAQAIKDLIRAKLAEHRDTRGRLRALQLQLEALEGTLRRLNADTLLPSH
jgi:hypothetical protein